MLLLDEFTYPMKFGWVDTGEVVEVLKNRPGFQHVIITGRDAPPELVEISDLVSEVNKVKAPLRRGLSGAEGDRVVEALPRIVIAGTHSGAGKTTVASGLRGRALIEGPPRRSVQGRP
jgi:ATP:corrinoid adenosyltransferase